MTLRFSFAGPALLTLTLIGTGLAGAPGAQASSIVWKPLRGESVPANAYSAAPASAEPVHICRVTHRHDTEIGTVRDFFCQIGGDGMSRPYSVYDVLTDAGEASWAPAKGGRLPEGALPLNETTASPVYACRVVYEGATIVGTVHASEGLCSASFAHSELQSDTFEVLVSR